MTGINAMNRFMRKLFRFIPLEQVMPVENVCADFPVPWRFLKCNTQSILPLFSPE